MFSPRLYRTGLVAAALALIVLGFSLRGQAPALSPTISPAAFSGTEAYATLTSLAGSAQSHPPGSPGDEAIARQVAAALRTYGFTPVQTDRFTAETVRGQRVLENVVGSRPGISDGSIVVLANRDAGTGPAPAALSGTAALLELARALSGETLRHTVVLASVSGSQGAAGAIALARSLAAPVDAVLSLGDLATPHPHGPVVTPWSDSELVAPPQLRNTLSGAIAAQTPFSPSTAGLGEQFAHEAFPLMLGDQAPFGSAGVPAVTVSLTPVPPAVFSSGQADETTLYEMGRAILSSISAIDATPVIAAPSSYLLLSGQIIPGWAVGLLGLGLLVPVLLTVLDGLARARRRGHRVSRALAAVLAAGAPCLVFCLVVAAGGGLGAFAADPAGPVAPGAIPVTGASIAVIAVALLGAALAGWGAWRVARTTPALRRRPRPGSEPWHGVLVAVPAVLCVALLLVWLSDPYAALLLIPALHLWLWVTSPDLPMPRVPRLLLVLAGIAVPLGVAVLYASSLGYGAGQSVWQGVLLLAGGAAGIATIIESSLVFGCLVGALTVAWLAGRRPQATPAPVTVRGPITYAGPGSLGGTNSALRR
jgi:hypothetical protein